MKKVILMIAITLFGVINISKAQVTQPLYLRFDGKAVDDAQYKLVDSEWTPQELYEDKYIYRYPVFGGYELYLATVDKRNSLEINISELSNYNVKTIQEINIYLTGKTPLEQDQYWGKHFDAKNLYVVEVLPAIGKARIHKVRALDSR